MGEWVKEVSEKTLLFTREAVIRFGWLLVGEVRVSFGIC
jgi:hypothetical protein